MAVEVEGHPGVMPIPGCAVSGPNLDFSAWSRVSISCPRSSRSPDGSATWVVPRRHRSGDDCSALNPVAQRNPGALAPTCARAHVRPRRGLLSSIPSMIDPKANFWGVTAIHPFSPASRRNLAPCNVAAVSNNSIPQALTGSAGRPQICFSSRRTP